MWRFFAYLVYRSVSPRLNYGSHYPFLLGIAFLRSDQNISIRGASSIMRFITSLRPGSPEPNGHEGTEIRSNIGL